MKINKLHFILLFFLCSQLKAQSGFPYDKAWGTYIGGCGTILFEQSHDGYSFHKDSQNNIYVNGVTYLQSGYTEPYYNQFVAGGGDAVNMAYSTNQYNAQLLPGGQMVKGSYTGNYSGVGNGYENLIGIDGNDHKFFLTYLPGQVPNLATPGAWLSQTTNSSSNYTYILSKYDAANNLIWKTYLPNPSALDNITLRFDENYNTYIIGKTREEIAGLSTSGVFQEHYIGYVGQATSGNSYIVKLNPSGQKIWATYSVPEIFDMDIYNGGLYALTNYQSGMPGTYTTSGTFQPDNTAAHMLIKFDGNTGQKTWGTFYGTGNPGFVGGAYDIEVNETGVYVSGASMDLNNLTYFATPGAFKGQMTGGSDLFLSKFDYTGNRIWGTYFGSNNHEAFYGHPNMATLGNRIIITGKQYGNTDNISTPGAYLTVPPNNSPTLSNLFFAEFDADGNRKWCSYLVGSGTAVFSEHYNPDFLNDGSLVIWGSTASTTGIGTENGAFPQMINPFPGQSFGYVVKFQMKQLGISDAEPENDLKLYDNPNNGNFYLNGSILKKQNTHMEISDMSGRLIHKVNLDRQKTQDFKMQGQLPAGSYLIKVSTEKGEKIKVFKMLVK